MFGDIPVYYINLKNSIDRNNRLLSQFKDYNVSNYNRVSAVYGASTSSIDGISAHDCPKNLSSGEYGCSLSHLKAIKTWLIESDSDYCIILEDDVDLSLSDLWEFSFEEFVTALPYDWDIVQLAITGVGAIKVQLHRREPTDYATAAYIIKRQYARKLIDLHHTSNGFDLMVGVKPRPVADELVYNAGICYSVPLLNFCCDFDSTIESHKHHVGTLHYNSMKIINKFWVSNSKKLNLHKLIGM